MASRSCPAGERTTKPTSRSRASFAATDEGAGEASLRASFAAARDRVGQSIADACARAGRDPRDVTLVAVSKGFPASRIQAAVDAGFTLLGENRVQEAAEKVPLVSGGRWHLVGHLQSNKARTAVGLFEAIESVDSVDLARRLDRLATEAGRRLPIYLEINVDADPAKTGFAPDEAEAALGEIAALRGLEIAGLMTVGRLVARAEEARPTFAALRGLSERLRGQDPSLRAGLSMGMSDDFEVAVEEGATVVRIGRAIFGERPGAAVVR